ncbi:MAG: hypothetical protein C0618_00410 [Desulfuromonas sp.]|nr:MAG: hypothetical protein C0618_00410 [Desulfuromonas sp.]
MTGNSPGAAWNIFSDLGKIHPLKSTRVHGRRPEVESWRMPMPKTSHLIGLSVFCCFALLGTILLTSCAAPESSRSAKSAARKTCLDCHKDYAQTYKAGVVHQPVQEDKCSTCHRTHGQIGGAFLREDEPNLCFRCHKELGNSLGQMQLVHAPVAEGTCQECHKPHNSENEKLLTAAEPTLCYKCHSQKPFAGKNVHQPVTEGCASCHPVHGSSTERLLVADTDELCASCHQLGSQAFSEKHGNFSVAENCLECHSVHSSDQTALLKNQVHAPVAGQECESCHQNPGAGNMALVAKGAELCYQCHEQIETADGKSHAPVASGDCLECHSPHASDFVGMIAESPESLCFKCHQFDFIGPEPNRPGQGQGHSIAAQGECLSCHQPHRPVAGQSALLSAAPESLCLECHEDVATVHAVAHPPAADGECLTCHQSHEGPFAGVLADPQQVLCAQCHDSVTEDMGKLSLHKPFSKGECSSCHSPHGAEAESLLKGADAETCDSCHQQLATERQLPNRHMPFVDGECASCHTPHASDQPGLLAASTGELCLSCHDDKTPVDIAVGRHDNCASCHAPHGNDGDFFLSQSLPQLCLNCHSVDVFWESGVGHQPAMEGECLSCHDPHFTDTDLIVQSEWTAELCGSCHDIEPDALKEVHNGIAPAGDSCRSCHNPHGGPDNTLTHPVTHEPFAEGDCAICHTGA